jgi:hypothetical protein
MMTLTPRGVSRGTIFALPTSETAQTAHDWLLRLGRKPKSRANVQLIELLNEHSKTLELPSATVVTDRIEDGDIANNCLLSILTVLAKSSAHVYLRDKEPNLTTLKQRRFVVVLLPREFGGDNLY